MAEIKSTLDLVMEKTKHLTLSLEEREQQKFDEARKKTKGLIQKYIDGVLTKEKFADQLKDLQATYGSMVDDLVLNMLLDGLQLGRDNQPLLVLLNEICGIDTKEFASIFESYKEEIQTVTLERVRALKALLEEEHSISGSAVVPNVETDKAWQTGIVEIHARFDQRLAGERAAVK